MAGQQEQQARPGIGRAELLNGLEERCADRVDGRQQTVVALAQGVRCQRRERQHLPVAGLQPGRAADFHLLLGQNLQDAMADEVLAGDLGVAGAGRRHVAAVMFAGQAGIVQVHHHGLLMIAVRRPAALPGRLVGVADTWQAFPSLGFTHSSRGIHVNPPNSASLLYRKIVLFLFYLEAETLGDAFKPVGGYRPRRRDHLAAALP